VVSNGSVAGGRSLEAALACTVVGVVVGAANISGQLASTTKPMSAAATQTTGTTMENVPSSPMVR